MGVWSYEVLTNDSALDMIGELVESKDIKADIYNIFHGQHDMHEFLLAVEIVDISLNGIDEDVLGGLYEYEEWFKNIEKTPMVELRDDAIHVIKFIQKVEEEQSGWVGSCKIPRKQLLSNIECRLKGLPIDMTQLQENMERQSLLQWLNDLSFSDAENLSMEQLRLIKNIVEGKTPCRSKNRSIGKPVSGRRKERLERYKTDELYLLIDKYTGNENMTVRIHNILHRNGYDTTKKLLLLYGNPDKIRKMRNCGEMSAKIIENAIRELIEREEAHEGNHSI